MNRYLNLRVNERRRNSTSAIYHFTSGQDGCRLNKIRITRVCTKIRDGSISEINQCNKGNLFTKYDAFNPKVHNSNQILHISAQKISLTITIKNTTLLCKMRHSNSTFLLQ